MRRTLSVLSLSLASVLTGLVLSQPANAAPLLALTKNKTGADSASSASGESLPFLGVWDCEVSTFAFSETIYDNGIDQLPIQEIQEGSDGSYTLLFDDDYFITLSGFADGTMNWLSGATGDSFTCTRIEQ